MDWNNFFEPQPTVYEPLTPDVFQRLRELAEYNILKLSEPDFAEWDFEMHQGPQADAVEFFESE